MTTSPAATPARPAPLPKSRVTHLAPNGRPFPWGPIDAVHSIAGIDVVEYRCDKSNFGQESAWAEHGETRFHPYLEGRDTSTSYYSLDSALVGAIALRRSGPNSQAAAHFDMITLGTISDEDARR